jgi:hypothetical protein
VKDYWLHPSSKASNLSREVEEDDLRNNLCEAADTEVKMWDIIYKGRFNAQVTFLAGKPSLIMPYGREISTQEEKFVCF